MLARLELLSEDDLFKMWGSIASVDVADLNEGKAKTLNLRFDLLEIALYHRSSWIVQLALYLYIVAADATLIRAAAIRLFSNGKNSTLAAAAHMAERLGAESAIGVACDRLLRPLFSGCKHIFELLQRLKPPPDDILLSAVESGLMGGDEDTAIAAAALANELENPLAQRLLPIVTRSYDHWLKQESRISRRRSNSAKPTRQVARDEAKASARER